MVIKKDINIYKKVCIFLIICAITFTGCRYSEQSIEENSFFEKSKPIENFETNAMDASYVTDDIQNSNLDNDSNNLKFFGIWSLDEIVLESNNYSGEKYRDGRKFSEKEYIGCEIEYQSQFFRLKDEKFFNPTYTLYDFTVFDYDINGDFQTPDFYDLIKNKQILVNKSEEYKDMAEVPLLYFTLSFNETHFIPIGSQCVMLNDNTMLVGVWGKIILSHRVEKDD